MTTWHRGPAAAFDLETTGIDVETDRVVTACVAIIRPTDTPPWNVEINTWLVNPGMEIPQGAIDVHGITNERVQADGRKPAEALDEIAAELARAQSTGIPIVGANLAYDNTLLDRELRRNGLATVEERLGRPLGPCIDVQVLDKRVDQYRPKTVGNRKLETLCKLYRVTLAGAHDSTFDAIAAARVAYRLGQMSEASVDELVGFYKGRNRPTDIARAVIALSRFTLDELHVEQIQWRAEQCESLRNHFDEVGEKHDGVPGYWPLHPYRLDGAL